MSTSTSKRYPLELRERAVRMVVEVRGEQESEWASMTKVAGLLGVGTPETVRKWVRQAAIDEGSGPGQTSQDSAEVKRLERENAELKRANSILKAAVGFVRGRTRPATSLIVAFIADHVGTRHADADGQGLRWGVESICAQLTELGCTIAPATYYEHRSRTPSKQQLRDEALRPKITAVHAANDGVYGARKVWLILNRQRPAGAPTIARCAVERLMRRTRAHRCGAGQGQAHHHQRPSRQQAS